MPRKKARIASESADALQVTRTCTPAVRKQLRGKLGGLKNMPNMPMDILIEIFSNLLPMDLLNLSRTSKSFRALLMSRTAASLWKRSRRLVEGLPDCPTHLSEPAYANLVFSAHCHHCCKPNTQTILWDFSVRYCRSCKKSLTLKSLDESTHKDFIYERFDDIWPLTIKFAGKNRCIFHVPQIDQLKKAWDEMHNDAERWAQYQQHERQRVAAIEEHAIACTIWALERANAKEEKLDQVRERRLQFIVSKLREMGWGEEIDKLPNDLYPLSDHTHVRLAREMSERTWEKIQDELSVYMQHIKDCRLTEERSLMLHIRLQTLDSVISTIRSPSRRNEATECLPKFADFALMPEFRALMEAPTEDILDIEAFTALIMQIRKLDLRWIMQRETLLANMIETTLGRVSDGPDGDPGREDGSEDKLQVLNLALAVFECRRCSERVHATDAIAHRCTRDTGRYWTLDLGADETEGTYMYEVRRISRRVCPWDISCFEVPDLDPLRRTIQACGKDPDSVTVQEMEESGVRLAVKNTLVDGKRKVMTWGAVMRTGHLDPIVRESAWQFEVLSPEDERRAVKLEPEKDEELVEELFSGKQGSTYRRIHCEHPDQ